MSKNKVSVSSAADALRLASKRPNPASSNAKKPVLSNSVISPAALEASWSDFLKNTPIAENPDEERLLADIEELTVRADVNLTKKTVAEAEAKRAGAMAEMERQKTEQAKVASWDKQHQGSSAKVKGTAMVYGKDPKKWTGRAKLNVLDYLLKNPSAQIQKTIEGKCSKAHSISANTVRKAIGDLKTDGWLSMGDSGICLNGRGIENAKKVLKNPGKSLS